ncbi:MAG: SMP-30/gluconolactonase/LRE family protein [Limnobacter sp.]|nr:SMP-30/gluconolactonase/LRE family protein [Limnobacter sp.]
MGIARPKPCATAVNFAQPFRQHLAPLQRWPRRLPRQNLDFHPGRQRTPASAALYCLQNGTVHEQQSGLIVGNGLAFPANEQTMYWCDTRHKTIWTAPYCATTGALGTATVLAQYSHGTERPDGAAADSLGRYWVAVLDGSRLDCFTPPAASGADSTSPTTRAHTHTPVHAQALPVPFYKPTMPCFGGPNLQELLVCAAAAPDSHPNASGFENTSLAVCTSPVAGVVEGFAKWPGQNEETR